MRHYKTGIRGNGRGALNFKHLVGSAGLAWCAIAIVGLTCSRLFWFDTLFFLTYILLHGLAQSCIVVYTLLYGVLHACILTYTLQYGLVQVCILTYTMLYGLAHGGKLTYTLVYGVLHACNLTYTLLYGVVYTGYLTYTLLYSLAQAGMLMYTLWYGGVHAGVLPYTLWYAVWCAVVEAAYRWLTPLQGSLVLGRRMYTGRCPVLLPMAFQGDVFIVIVVALLV